MKSVFAKKYSFCLSYSGKVGAPSKDKKEKKEKKKEEKPKAAPAPKEPEPVEEPDAADEALSLEPKSKDPFDAMPKGTFNFEDFKRFYSNNDEAVSIPYFWEKFDKENYSIWFGEYKYNEELTQVFMSCNLIGGELIKLVHFLQTSNLVLENKILFFVAYRNVPTFGQNEKASLRFRLCLR